MRFSCTWKILLNTSNLKLWGSYYFKPKSNFCQLRDDVVVKLSCYDSVLSLFFPGRVHHALNNHQKAVEYLRQGLQIAEQLGRMEDEAKIRHRLGLALWGNGSHEECQQQLYKASELFESIRRDAQFNSEYKLSLFDLQTACYQALQVQLW